MRSKNKQIREAKHKKFVDELNQLTSYFDNKYPGWQNSKDADYIKTKINRTAKKWTTGIYLRKTKVLYKKDFPDKWPFYEDSVIIVQTAKRNATVKMVTVLIGLQEYALTGLSADYFQIKLVHDAGKAIKEMSTDLFFRMGVEL